MCTDTDRAVDVLDDDDDDDGGGGGGGGDGDEGGQPMTSRSCFMTFLPRAHYQHISRRFDLYKKKKKKKKTVAGFNARL